MLCKGSLDFKEKTSQNIALALGYVTLFGMQVRDRKV